MHVFKTITAHTLPNIAAGESKTQSMTVGGLPNTAQYSVHVSPSGALPSGLLLSHSFVSATDTVQAVFHNATSSQINTADYNFFITAHRVDYAY